MELIFASHNENKVEEIRKLLPSTVQLRSLNNIGYLEEIDEPGITLEENAKIKAKTIFDVTQKTVFADDSGLFVDALRGAPGVFSARYAGTGNSEDNIVKLLTELENETHRTAYFRCVFCFLSKDFEHYFDGEIHGKIANEPTGKNGFGYDPVFIPDGFAKTFAELSPTEKNQMSHRAIAVKKMINFIKTF